MRYPLFGVSQQGKSPNITAQNRINLYLDVQPQEDKSLYSLHGTPGLAAFVDLGEGPIRGMWKVGELMYVVHQGTFYEITNAGVATSRGTLNTTSGRVDMRDNHAGVIHISDGTNGYFYTIASTTFAEITDADYNDNTETVEYHDGYFIYPKKDTGEFYLSSADATNVASMADATDFATAEKAPDNLVRVFDNTTEILLLGDETIEFWNNRGEGDFPYERVAGGVIELGLASKWAIARFAESSVMLLAKNSDQGDVKVIRIQGFQYADASIDSEFESIINTYSTVSDATAFSYTKEGHPFFQLNFPTEGKSWLYDGKTGLWSQLQYGNGGRHRADMGVNFLGKFYVGDYETGKVYRLAEDVYTDDGQFIVREFTSRHIFDEKPVRISRLWMDMESGVGLNGQEAPILQMRISRDGGHSWGNWKEETYGAIGEYAKRVIFRRLGRAFDWVFQFRTTAPVKTVFVGSWINTV